MKNANMPASPVENCIMDDSGDYTGMTKREAFAMAAMQGLSAFEHIEYKFIAEQAVGLADALLKELSK